jgi:hypothetical protein
MNPDDSYINDLLGDLDEYLNGKYVLEKNENNKEAIENWTNIIKSSDIKVNISNTETDMKLTINIEEGDQELIAKILSLVSGKSTEKLMYEYNLESIK